MKQNVPLSFIFIYDDSDSMYSGTRNSNNIRLGEAQTTRVIILQAVKALLAQDNSARGYNIEIGLGGTSSKDDNFEVGLKTYAEVENYLSNYHSGVTDYTVGLNNALKAAQAAKNDTDGSRTPIVVWLSDFHQAFSGSALRRTGDYAIADQLHAIAPVYGLSTDHVGGATVRNVLGDNWRNRIFPMRTEALDEGIQSLQNIIWDAIGYYMKDQVVITDNLSNALSDRGTTAGTASAGTEATGTGKERAFSGEERGKEKEPGAK